jgi:ribosome-associated translation inhibitor RaiA
MRARKENGQTLINGFALGIVEWQVVRLARLKRLATQCICPNFKLKARYPHDAHRSPARCRGNGNDGVLVARQHGSNLMELIETYWNKLDLKGNRSKHQGR